MILVTGSFRIPIAKREEACRAMARVIAATLAEDGCESYAYAEDVLDRGLFRVTERWTSREALTAHFEAPHMIEWQAERIRLGMMDREVTAHTVTGSEPL